MNNDLASTQKIVTKSTLKLYIFSFLFFGIVFAGFPDKPIKIVVYTGPGGLIDITARKFSSVADKYVDATFVVENKPGAGGIVALKKVLQAPEERVSFEVFNAGGKCNNFNKQAIVDELLRHFPNAPVKYKEKGSDPRNYKVNFSKIRNVLGFEPKYTVSDGIVALISALQQNIFSRVEQQRNFYHNYEIENS